MKAEVGRWNAELGIRNKEIIDLQPVQFAFSLLSSKTSVVCPLSSVL
jgi:hypothetical protein